MFTKDEMKKIVSSAAAKKEFALLYGAGEEMFAKQSARYERLVDSYIAHFGDKGEAPAFFSAPGRTEIVGNHTDHNNGCVLAAAVTLDTLAAAAPNGTDTVRLYSAGYDKEFVIDLHDLEKKDSEINTTDAILRGVCYKCREMGIPVKGFNADVTSLVLGGSGLSSSAAFEVLLITVVDGLFGGGQMDGVTRAKVGQWVENVYFGKPSGLMDQSASSIGGLVGIDFADNTAPVVKAHAFDFEKAGYKVVVMAAKSSHADLTDEYAAIPAEMKAVAAALGKKVLRETSKEELMGNLPAVREQTSDRAVMRALHYFDENERVIKLYDAIDKGDLSAFLAGVIASGESSWKLLQNLYVGGRTSQSLALACALSEELLASCGGAWRVHGGGFAGTILAFVPEKSLETYVSAMNSVFGEGACTVLGIRPVGAKKVEL